MHPVSPRKVIHIHMYVTGMLGDFGGHTQVIIYPESAILLQMGVVLASLILGLMNAG